MTVDIWELHTGTLGISAVLLTAAIAAMAFITARTSLVGTRAARAWGWAMAAAAAAFFFWFVGQALDDWVEFLPGNVSAVAFSVLFLRAAHLLVGRPLRRAWLVAHFMVGASGIAAVALASAPRGVAVFSIALSFLWAGAGFILAIARHREMRASGWGKALVLVLAVWCCGVTGARLYVLFFGAGPESVRAMASTTVQVWALFSTILMLVVVSLGFLAILADQQHRAALESARRDGLTGALTRTAFFEQAEQRAGRAPQYAVMMLDVDHFKRVNDNHGHLGGDTVLRHAAAQLLRCVRSADLVGRYGGEEFCVLLPDCDADEAAEVARRVCQQSARHPARLQDGQSVAFTVSIGVAISDGCSAAQNDAAALERVIDLADRALYRAKSQGRNQVQVFDPEAPAGSGQSRLAPLPA
ncbi:GGDEF domain-containing protein [Pseudorhodoferax sp. Leaf267]|uniref:GGDEF domain-containing protein n=1 Tax=Pseudorhodoferax sp. Leaf267 TaxID=1736316 RepID=UPI0006FD46A6|nr:GGDEF domain-containing protein [Pseudorhodoferax sp. Leaf267]KQP15799.1 hypothetical protein ASF43_29550 [Pseudorhodoferax sp. Leaf267]